MIIVFKWIIQLLFFLLLASCFSYHSLDSDFKQTKPSHVSVTHGQIEYYRVGHGSPIVLIPGYMTDVTSWNATFISALAKKHEVILLNNRHVGKSYNRSRNYHPKDLAKDTHELIKNLHLKKPTLLGISMGGMIAQEVAVMYPNEMDRLILINTAIAGKKAVHPDKKTEMLMLHMPASKLGRYHLAINEFFPSSWRWKMAWALAKDRFLPNNYTEIEPSKVMADQRKLILEWASDDRAAAKIATLPMPVLILSGEADTVIPPINSIILKSTIPHAELHRFEEGGHAMIYQYPNEMANLINFFIK